MPDEGQSGSQDVFPGSSQAEAEGIVERIVYENPDNGFMVARLRIDGQHDLVTFVGSLMAVSPGETIQIIGEWIDDKKFGKQIRVTNYKTVLPNSLIGIEKYLGSGLIHGIGPAYAERLIKAFGIETLKVIDEQPERLRTVEGIGPKRASQIREAWSDQKNIQSIMVFLQGHGIGTNQAVKIYKKYGDGAVTVLRDNPYRLIDDISGIGFAGADKVATNLGLATNSPTRIAAGINFCLRQMVSEGHTFGYRAELVSDAEKLLSVSEELVLQRLDAMVHDRELQSEEDRIFLHDLYDEESDCAHHLKRIFEGPKETVTDRVDIALKWVEKKQNIALSDEQKEALRTAVDAPVMVITGGPGTGKTTLINSILAVYQRKNFSLLLAAPTGRAAKRMEVTTGHEAKTIHRLLEFNPKIHDFNRNQFNPLDADVIVIDEMSMVDIHLMASVLKAIPDEARLLLVGDVDQLPSVGPGNVLMDIIASTVVPTVRLKTVFRQAAESGIISNAHRINTGDMPEWNTTDFFFVERNEPEAVRDTVIELVANRIPKKFRFDPWKDIQVLSPMHRGEAGVANLNTYLQEALNPDGHPIPRKGFRVGDKVIQTRNNYELDVYNGDVGRITVVSEEVKELHVEFEDRTALYTFDDMDDLNLAYAITVHKSQGSEYPALVIPLASQHYLMLQRNIFYTAITRGKSLVVIVGDTKALRRALSNTDVSRRNTRLAERLRGTT
ncbi:MAG: ATP-dependent RecD-like DNA helicase [Candidatus Hydrogenedentota bacterium]